MRRIVSLLVVSSLVLGGISLALAQEQSRRTPPKVLRIFREEVKPGKTAAHEKVEVGWPRAFAKANYSTHYLGMTSMTGPSEAWFLEGHDSYASVERAEQETEKNAVLQAELQQLSQQDGELLNSLRTILAEYREDLSYRANINVGQYRYFQVVTYRVRPGHDAEFVEARKMVNAAHDQASVDEHWAVFQVFSGAPAGTYLLFIPFKSLTEVDAGEVKHGKAYQDALGDDGRKKLREAQSAALMSSETNIFTFNPKMSYVSKEFVAANPDFWMPKTKVAAKSAAPKVASQQ